MTTESQPRELREPRPPIDYDMPVEHLNAELDSVVAKSRDQARIDYLRSMPPGTARAEAQLFGQAVASGVLDTITDPDDITFSVDIIAAAGINTAWYNGASGSIEVMRRRLKLPKLATVDGIVEPASLWQSGRQQFRGAIMLADTVARETKTRSPKLPERKRQYMRQLGNASLTLACSQLPAEITEVSAYNAQIGVRLQSQRVLRAARELGEVIGKNPSLRQFEDADSELSVYWRRHAPNGARQALLNAVALRRQADAERSK
jgi:hypothetical protein